MSAAAIEAQFDLGARVLEPRRSARQVARELLVDTVGVTQFRFIRISCFIAVALLFSVVLFGVENNYNPVYLVGKNISASQALNASAASTAPATGIPSGLAYIDALFVSTSLLSNTGLTPVDFSKWCFASQIIAIVIMVIGCLPLSSSIPLWVRLVLTRRDGGSRIAQYKALRMVTLMILIYVLFFCILMSFLVGFACAFSPNVARVFSTADPPVNPYFGGFFLGIAAFTNCGFSPLGNSVMSLAPFPGLVFWLAMMIIVGNIAFPATLRLFLEVLWLLGLERRWGLPISLVRRNPRAYFKLLFPRRYILFLSCFWLAIYVTNWSLVMGLEWNNTMAGLDPGAKVTAAIFSSSTNRTAGLNVLATGSFRYSLLVFNMVMFVINNSPNNIAIRVSHSTRRREAERESAGKYTKELLINVVAGLTFCWILILLFENANEIVSQPFPTLFEITSAFGTVGLSMGYANSNASLSGVYSIPSKLVIVVLMVFGAHRGLPENADASVRVTEMPSGHAHAIEGIQIPGREGSATKPRLFMTKADVSFMGNGRGKRKAIRSVSH